MTAELEKKEMRLSPLKVVPKLLFPHDEGYQPAVDWFIIGTVLAGADSVAKVMAATYLAQFQDLHGELAQRPVYPPNFHVGSVPYSNLLLAHLNNVVQRNLVYLPAGQQELDTHFGNSISQGQADKSLEWLIKEGAQFSLLYQANKKILKEHDSRELFRAVRDCYFRDQKMAEILSYLEEPSAEKED